MAPAGGNFMAFPNPAGNATRIDYQLAAGTVGAELVLNSTNGQEVKRMPLGNSSGSIQLTTALLAAGTYLCRIEAQGSTIVGDRLVVVH